MKKITKIAIIPLVSAAIFTTGCAPVIIGGAATAGYMASQERGFETSVSDVSLKTHIKDRLTNKNYRYLTAVGVSVLQAEVLLTGVVGDNQQRTEIEAIVRETPGVKQVFNELIVADTYTAGEQSQDAWIATQIKSGLLTGKDVYAINYMTEVIKGNVYITGLASSEAERERVLYIARTVKGVKQVVNYIRISEREAGDSYLDNIKLPESMKAPLSRMSSESRAPDVNPE